jgi:hypothetical protein
MGHLARQVLAHVSEGRCRAGCAEYLGPWDGADGTRIRHPPPPPHVLALPIAMVFAALVACLMPRIGARLRQPAASAHGRNDGTRRTPTDVPHTPLAEDPPPDPRHRRRCHRWPARGMVRNARKSVAAYTRAADAGPARLGAGAQAPPGGWAPPSSGLPQRVRGEPKPLEVAHASRRSRGRRGRGRAPSRRPRGGRRRPRRCAGLRLRAWWRARRCRRFAGPRRTGIEGDVVRAPGRGLHTA